MKRFAWWFFLLFLLYTLISAGNLPDDPTESLLVELACVAVFFWPLWAYLRDRAALKRGHPWTRYGRL